MSTYLFNFYKNLFDEMAKEIWFSFSEFTYFVNMIEDDENLSARHYDTLRRYAINKCYELSK